MKRRERKVGFFGVFLAGAAVSALAGCSLQPGTGPNATSIVGLVTPPTPAEAAAWAADPYDSDKRQRGMLLLANAPFGGERVYLELYRARLADSEAAVRGVAARALAMHGQPEDAPAIAARLTEDGDELVRREAARALQRIHNAAVVPALLQASDASKEPDVDTRSNAARALGQYAEPRVVQALIRALQDRRLAVNKNALASLEVLTGKAFGTDAKGWVTWSTSEKNLFANRGVYEFPVFQRDPTIVEFLLPFWGPPNEQPGQRPVGMAASEAAAGASGAAPAGGSGGGL